MDKEEEIQWLKRMIALEEERGEFPPGGFGGGVGAKTRRWKERVVELTKLVESDIVKP